MEAFSYIQEAMELLLTRQTNEVLGEEKGLVGKHHFMLHLLTRYDSLIILWIGPLDSVGLMFLWVQLLFMN